jgi:fatty acid CoA ligase FadD9
MVQGADQNALLQRVTQRVRDMIATDPELQRLKPKPAVIAQQRDPNLSYPQVLSVTFAGYAERPALGSRAYEIAIDPATGEAVRKYLPAYRTISYGELAQQVESIASLWRRSARYLVSPGEMVAFIAFSGAEMATVDFACAYAHAVAAPLQANQPTKDMEEILSETAPVALVASIDNLVATIGYALNQKSVRSILVIDADERVDAERRAIEGARERLASDGGTIALITFAEAVREGGEFEFEPLAPPKAGRDRLAMLVYTSGSTGTPKGAMFHDGICASIFGMSREGGPPSVSFIYAPLNHLLGRHSLHGALAQGGTAYFSLKTDLSTLLEDVRLARPTFISFIPRICELVHQHYLAEVERRVAAGADPDSAGKDVRAAMSRTFLGDRLVSGIVSTAPVSSELQQFISECFDIPLMIGYGSTESGGSGVTRNGRVLEGVLDYKLINVPELGYYTTDKPYPRGELLFKTSTMVKGYFNRPEATAAVFDEDGFFKSGDIMEQRGPDHLIWIDRRNNVTKLSQGEYVAIGPLETIFLGHGALIRQLYLYGSAQRAFLLAVVVPDIEAAQAMLGREPSDADLRRLVLDDMRNAAREAELKSFEVPRDVLIEREPFTRENGLLSSVMKPLRPKLKARYADALEAMYEDTDRQQAEALKRLRDGEGQTTLERVIGALKVNLGFADVNAQDASYRELGGDSLGAVNMALLLEEIFGIALPVSAILHPGASAARIAAQIDDLRTSSGSAVRYETVHPNPAAISASELQLDNLVDGAALRAAASAAPPVSKSRTVLLTGANGFLGRFLCLEWLEQLAKIDGKLICLVRGDDQPTARARLAEAFDSTDPELTRRFEALAASHLEVLPADLAAPKLGLDDAIFTRLADQVDQIVHVAALVNHRFSYRNLFEPNVLGTAELVRLALIGRLKRFDYVSSVAVCYANLDFMSAPEDADVRLGAPLVKIAGDQYAGGYGASKWAGEVVLRDAHERFGLPVNVFRADMILAHARYKGQINVPDSFTRLLYSVIQAGVAPRSFYELGPDGGRQSAHYNGLPVDFVAAAMQQIGGRGDDGFQTYNFVNMHYDDGVSLDAMVDWIEAFGYEIARVDDYNEWLRRFEEKLRNLPDEKRQNSCLNIMGRLQRPTPAQAAHLSCTAFQTAVRDIAAGPDVPQLSQDYIHKCVEDMQLLKLIDLPTLVRT